MKNPYEFQVLTELENSQQPPTIISSQRQSRPKGLCWNRRRRRKVPMKICGPWAVSLSSDFMKNLERSCATHLWENNPDSIEIRQLDETHKERKNLTMSHKFRSMIEPKRRVSISQRIDSGRQKIPDPTYNTPRRISTGSRKTHLKSTRPPDQTRFCLKLGHNDPRNQAKINCKMGRSGCQTAQGTPQQVNLRGIDRWPGLSQGECGRLFASGQGQSSYDAMLSKEETAEGNFVRASRIEINTGTPETNCKKSLRPKRNESNLCERTYGTFPLWPCTHAHHSSRGFENTRSQSRSKQWIEKVEITTSLGREED